MIFNVKCLTFKLSCDICCIVVRFYCSNKDVKYELNFKLSRDKTIHITTLLELFRISIEVKSTLVKESIKRQAVPAYFEVFFKYSGMAVTRKQKLAIERIG